MASGDTLLVFTPLHNEPPATNYATLDTRNQHPVLDYDAATDENAIFSGVMPRNYAGGGVTVYIHWAMTSATTNSADMNVAFERIGDEVLDIDADSFAAPQSRQNETVPATSGHVKISNIAFTDGAQMDSIAVGEGFRVRVTRNATTDDAAGDMELLFVELKET